MRIVYTVTEAPEKPRRRLSPEARREIVRRLGAGAAVQALAVDEGHSDLNFCGLAVRVSGGDAFAEGLEVEQVQCHRFERTCEGIFASTRLRVWYPVQRFPNARP